ncbi:hypothetical protein AB3X91_20180 [Paraburkholderia sp. BR14263]|uniref:hypothetical protein n=1 Tax=unclassified Paraburkholderia TaxID=2615204 RepID=UPI0034CF8A0C
MTTPQEHIVDWLRDAYAMEKHLPQEVAMARWLLDHLPDTVTKFVTRSAADRADAKR